MRYDIMVRNVSGGYEVFASARTLKSMLRKFEQLFTRHEDEEWKWYRRDNDTGEIIKLS